jgi:hypothetical protein
MNVLVRKDNQERGPYTEAEVRERLKSGVFSGSDLGKVEGESEWKPLAEILLASVLATDKPTATPSRGRDFTANYPWLREPKVIGGAVVLLLLIFGGINWLNKASEKRKEEAAAARQQAVMQQAQKQAEEYSQQAQERAAKARQAQLDQVKQMMAMTEKSQRDYQEKQKREQEERQKAEQAKIDAEQRKKEEVNKDLEKRRLAAEAKQKAVEAEFLKNIPKPVAASTPAIAGAPATAPSITLSSMPLGPLPKERERMLFSDDQTRLFVIATQGSRTQAIVDGVPGPLCRKLRWPYQRESLGAASWSHDIRVPGPPPFSPDKKRVAYIMELDNDKQAVVIDGVQSPVYDKVAWLGFGPNGHHVAYIAVVRGPPVQPGRRQSASVTMVDNGKAGPTFDAIAEAALVDRFEGEEVVFSADGEHLAYIGTKEKESPQRNHHFVVIDGHPQPRDYERIAQLRLSHDGQHAAYVATNSKGYGYESKVVLDGREGPGFPEIKTLVLSEDGSRCAYVIGDQSGDKMAVVDKGTKGGVFKSIENLVVSTNGQRVAYIGDHGAYESKVVVDNGKESVPYDRCEALKVSSDGSLLSFVVESSQGKLIVVNGQEFGPFYNIHDDLTYSRDGKHWACSVEANSSSGSGQLLTDGETVPMPKDVRGSNKLEYAPDKGWLAKTAGGELDIKTDLVMSPDGKHSAHSVVDRTKTDAVWHVVVDGFSGPDFDYQTNYNLASSKFNPDGSLTFIAAMKGQLARYTYSAEALKFMPTIGQTESVTPGVRILQNFSNNHVSRHIVINANGTIYGTVADGGEFGHGAFFSIKNNGTAAKIIHSFYGNDEDGNLDAGAYGEVFLGQNGIVYGQAGTIIFRYDPAKNEYGVVAKGVDSQSHLKGVFADGSLFFEGGNKYANENNWAVMPKDGSDLEPVGSGNKASKFVAIGPDDAIYSVTDDSLLRQATVYSTPTVLHKFVDLPQDAKRPDQYVTFDPTGVVYGSAKSGDARRSIVYRVKRDGSDYRLLLGQAQKFHVSDVVAGDDGALYGHLVHEKQSGLCRLSPQGGQPEFLDMKGDSGQFQDGAYADSMRPMVFHKSALYHTTQDTLVKVQLPRTGEAARLNPIVTIKTVAVTPLTSAEPISFTASAGEALPTAKAPDKQAGAAIWQPPAPGSTVTVATKQSTPSTQHLLPPSKGGSLPNADFGNEASSTSALGQQEASQFAMNTVSAMSAGDVNTLASLYAGQVDFQDKGLITNDALQSEFQQYFGRWPQASWQLTGAVAVQPLGASRCQITFPVSFAVANAATNKRATGVARETMVLEQDGSGAWKIVKERQTITSRNAAERERKREREKVYEGKPINPRPSFPIPPNIRWPPDLPRP